MILCIWYQHMECDCSLHSSIISMS